MNDKQFNQLQRLYFDDHIVIAEIHYDWTGRTLKVRYRDAGGNDHHIGFRDSGTYVTYEDSLDMRAAS